jgi:hypothetical protein
MVIHVCLAVTFWHCERSAAAAGACLPAPPPTPWGLSPPLTGHCPRRVLAPPSAAGKKWQGSNFCKVGYRQQWPGEFSSLNVKGIQQVHFWAVRACDEVVALCACASDPS